MSSDSKGFILISDSWFTVTEISADKWLEKFVNKTSISVKVEKVRAAEWWVWLLCCCTDKRSTVEIYIVQNLRYAGFIRPSDNSTSPQCFNPASINKKPVFVPAGHNYYLRLLLFEYYLLYENVWSSCLHSHLLLWRRARVREGKVSGGNNVPRPQHSSYRAIPQNSISEQDILLLSLIQSMFNVKEQ